MLAMAFFKILTLSSDPTKQTEIQIALNVILVFVTVVYVIITNLILSDSKKSREIDFKRLQLETFYLPLHFALTSMEEFKKPSPELDFLFSHIYLGEGDVPQLLIKYADYKEKKNLSDEEVGELRTNLSTKVNKDIEIIKKDIQKLRNV
ncbi:hypothetical protein [Methanolobus psychrotolerans]|uniref:hypothetical protein n=1 Tax=Methanolobus psychrotolerans TaxID=1874706 RepID=UPI0013EE30CC|nr:hypothetical protein [Methanolobus psychrotolerans]